MDFSTLSLTSLIATLMIAATPILLAAIGELIVEKSGILNLGVEGMMIVGAASGYILAIETGSAWLGFIAALCAGALIALIFAVVTQIFLANQVASGLALTLFGLGLSAMMGHDYAGLRPPSFPKWDIPLLGDIPLIGPVLFRHDPIVYIGLLLIVTSAWFLSSTAAGRILRAVGENHTAAHALGYKVVRIRILAIMFGGACAGLGGAYLSLVRVPQWTEGMTAGAGWIALAIVVFASWKPERVLFGAYLFGGVVILQLNLQAVGLALNVAYLSMAPYLITILALVLLSVNRRRAIDTPRSLGKTFHASD